MCLQTKNIIECRDVIFMEDGTSVGNALEMHPSGRNEGRTLVVMNGFSRPTSCNDGEQRNEKMGDHLIANDEAIKIPTENDARVEKFGKDKRYSTRERPPLGEWWKYYILPQLNEK